MAATRPHVRGLPALYEIHTLNFRPQMATVRPRVMPMPTRQRGHTGRILEHAVVMPEESIVTKVLSFIPDRDSNQVQLAYADVVVAGGLGLNRQATSSW